MIYQRCAYIVAREQERGIYWNVGRIAESAGETGVVSMTVLYSTNSFCLTDGSNASNFSFAGFVLL